MLQKSFPIVFHKKMNFDAYRLLKAFIDISIQLMC